MTPTEYLLSRGWRIIAAKRGKYRNMSCWAHDNHQHPSGLFYTTTQAERHQKFVDKHSTCKCVSQKP